MRSSSLRAQGVQERITLAFFSLVFLLLSTLTPTLGLILPELSVVQKEVQNNHYSVGSYYLAKTIVDTPLLLSAAAGPRSRACSNAIAL